MYRFYLDSCLLPVAPSKLNVSIKDYNETITLIDGTEAIFPKKGGSREFSFDALLPNREYPFAVYDGGRFKDAKYFIDNIELLKGSKDGFLFIVERYLPDGSSLFDTCVNVVIGDLSYVEGGENGSDIRIFIKLKEYVKPQAKKTSFDSGTGTLKQTKIRESSFTPPKTYTVKSGDSLWKICKQNLGDGGKCYEIASLNGIGNPNLIYPGQVIKLE